MLTHTEEFGLTPSITNCAALLILKLAGFEDVGRSAEVRAVKKETFPGKSGLTATLIDEPAPVRLSWYTLPDASVNVRVSGNDAIDVGLKITSKLFVSPLFKVNGALRVVLKTELERPTLLMVIAAEPLFFTLRVFVLVVPFSTLPKPTDVICEPPCWKIMLAAWFEEVPVILIGVGVTAKSKRIPSEELKVPAVAGANFTTRFNVAPALRENGTVGRFVIVNGAIGLSKLFMVTGNVPLFFIARFTDFVAPIPVSSNTMGEGLTLIAGATPVPWRFKVLLPLIPSVFITNDET
jgi:hypothetical protein